VVSVWPVYCGTGIGCPLKFNTDGQCTPPSNFALASSLWIVNCDVISFSWCISAVWAALTVRQIWLVSYLPLVHVNLTQLELDHFRQLLRPKIRFSLPKNKKYRKCGILFRPKNKTPKNKTPKNKKKSSFSVPKTKFGRSLHAISYKSIKHKIINASIENCKKTNVYRHRSSRLVINEMPVAVQVSIFSFHTTQISSAPSTSQKNCLFRCRKRKQNSVGL